MTLGERVRSYREDLEWDQAKLAAAVRANGGRASQSTISDIELGNSLNPRCLPQLAEIFGVTEKHLREGNGPPPGPPGSNVRMHPQPVDNAARPVADIAGDNSVARTVMFWGRLAETADNGGWVVYPERAAEQVELSPVLPPAPRAFKVEVLDAANSPVYEPRDILWCDPDKQPVGGNYCVFAGKRGTDGIPVILGMLVAYSATEWTVKPYAAEQKTLSKFKYPYAWIVFRRDQAI